MPEQPRRTAQTEAVKRLQAGRRASRGLVAGYIHQLSARHIEPRPERRDQVRAPQAVVACAGAHAATAGDRSSSPQAADTVPTFTPPPKATGRRA